MRMEAATGNKANQSDSKAQNTAVYFERVAVIIILTVIAISGLLFYIY